MTLYFAIVNGCTWNRVCVVYLELCRVVLIVVDARGQQIEELPEETKILARHVGNLEDRTYPARANWNQIFFLYLQALFNSFIHLFIH